MAGVEHSIVVRLEQAGQPPGHPVCAALAERARGQDHRPEEPQLHLRLHATTDVVHAPPRAGDAPDAVQQDPEALRQGSRHDAGPPASTYETTTNAATLRSIRSTSPRSGPAPAAHAAGLAAARAACTAAGARHLVRRGVRAPEVSQVHKCWKGRQSVLLIYGATLGVVEVVGSVVVGVATAVSSVGVAVASVSVGSGAIVWSPVGGSTGDATTGGGATGATVTVGAGGAAPPPARELASPPGRERRETSAVPRTSRTSSPAGWSPRSGTASCSPRRTHAPGSSARSERRRRRSQRRPCHGWWPAASPRGRRRRRASPAGRRARAAAGPHARPDDDAREDRNDRRDVGCSAGWGRDRDLLRRGVGLGGLGLVGGVGSGGRRLVVGGLRQRDDGVVGVDVLGSSSSTSSWAGLSHPATPHPAASAGSGGSSVTARSGSVRSSDTSRLPFLATPRHYALTRSDQPMVPDEGRGISEARRRRTPRARPHEPARRRGSFCTCPRARRRSSSRPRRRGWCTCGCSWAGSSGLQRFFEQRALWRAVWPASRRFAPPGRPSAT